MTKRKKLVILGAAVLGSALLLAGTFGYVLTRTSPEKRFYEAMATEVDKNLAGVEESIENPNAIFTGAAVFPDDNLKLKAAMTCKAKSQYYGDITIKVSVNQLNEKVYMHFDEYSFANSDDKAWEDEANASMKDIFTGKWIQMREDDKQYLGYKEHGVYFGMVGATSKKMNASQIAEEVKKHKLITILNTRDTTIKGEAATEYSLSVRRSAYEKFMDSVAPGYKYKDDVLDTLFSDDQEDVTVVVSNSDPTNFYVSYSMENPCRDFITALDEEAAGELPTRVRIKSYAKPNSDVSKLAAPATFITEDEFDAQLAE